MNFIILADKFQKGMKSKGAVGLLDYNKTNVIQYQLSVINKNFPKAKVVYVYGFDQKKVECFLTTKIKNVTSIYNPYYSDKNYVYSLYVAKEYLNEECFISFGDILFKNNTFKNFQGKKTSRIFLNQNNKNQLGCIIHDNKILNISFGLNNYLTNMYYLSKQDAKTASEIICQPKIHNYFIFELANKLIDANVTLEPFYVTKKSIVNYSEVNK